MTLLRAEAVAKHYGAVKALGGVDIEIARGEIVGLAGENGSGKSTLSKILAGIVRRDAGEILVDGEARHFRGPRDAAACGISLVAQEVTAVPAMTVAENVLLGKLPGPLGRFRRRSLAAEAIGFLERVGVTCDPLAPFDSLALGDRELTQVARALASRPRLLILDEATSRLGAREVKRLFTLLKDLREDGVATILITHRLNEICEMADRTVVLRDGLRVGELSAAETTEERLAARMVGRELKQFFHKHHVARREPRLEVENLVADGARAPVSLSVRAGEIVGLAGLVGSGRTELLETIAGLRRARGGRVIVDNEAISVRSPAAALEAGIALLPEDRHRQGLVLNASVRANIAMSSWKALSRARRPAEQDNAVREVEKLRIRVPNVDVPVAALSGGNQQKVVFARVVACEPKVLLLDEPTRGVDVGAKEEIFQIIGDMVQRGLGIVLASSDMLEILGLSDRVLVFHERRIVAEFGREEATEERIALAASGGHAELSANGHLASAASEGGRNALGG